MSGLTGSKYQTMEDDALTRQVVERVFLLQHVTVDRKIQAANQPKVWTVTEDRWVDAQGQVWDLHPDPIQHPGDAMAIMLQMARAHGAECRFGAHLPPGSGPGNPNYTAIFLRPGESPVLRHEVRHEHAAKALMVAALEYLDRVERERVR